NAETEAGLEGCEPVVPGAICANRKPGSNENASAVSKHRQCGPVRRRFKPLLKSERSPNANLIIIEAEKIDVAVVLAVEVIGADAEPPRDQHVNGGFDKEVIVVPRCIHSAGRGEIIRILIPASQTEVHTPEQALL